MTLMEFIHKWGPQCNALISRTTYDTPLFVGRYWLAVLNAALRILPQPYTFEIVKAKSSKGAIDLDITPTVESRLYLAQIQTVVAVVKRATVDKCDMCGTPHDITNRAGWITSRCDYCVGKLL